MRDNTLTFDDNVERITTVNSASIDFDAVNPDIGQGNPIHFCSIVSLAYDSTSTILASLADSADDSSFAVIVTGIVSGNAPALGTVLTDLTLPSTSRRHLRAQYIATGTATVGNVSTYLDIHHLAKK